MLIVLGAVVLLIVALRYGRISWPSSAADKSVAWVTNRAQSIGLRPEETRFDALGFAHNLDEGLQLARQHHRMLLLVNVRGEVCAGRI